MVRFTTATVLGLGPCIAVALLAVVAAKCAAPGPQLLPTIRKALRRVRPTHLAAVAVAACTIALALGMASAADAWPLPTPTNRPAATRCMEDNPCWNPCTMGNGTVGLAGLRYHIRMWWATEGETDHPTQALAISTQGDACVLGVVYPHV